MLNLDQIHLLLNTPEDEFHDFKQKWHHSKTELVRDILNFVNTSHHEDCYIIFGIDNITLDIIGVTSVLLGYKFLMVVYLLEFLILYHLQLTQLLNFHFQIQIMLFHPLEILDNYLSE